MEVDAQPPPQPNGAEAGGQPQNNARVDPSWKRVWQLPELRDAVQSWTLASDAGVCIFNKI